MSEKRKKFMQKLSGGLADSKKPSDFNEESLKEGTKVEMEHTDDANTAKEIAMDHLTEDSAYYQKLKTIEKSFQNMYGYIRKGGQGSGIKGHKSELQNKKAALESYLKRVQVANRSKTHADLNAKEEKIKTAIKIINTKLQYLGKAEELEKSHKYIRRTGTEGNYKYIYEDKEVTPEQKEKDKQKDKIDAKYRPSPGTVTFVPLIEHYSDSKNLIAFKRLLKDSEHGDDLRGKIGYNSKNDTLEIIHPDAKAIVAKIEARNKKASGDK